MSRDAMRCVSTIVNRTSKIVNQKMTKLTILTNQCANFYYVDADQITTNSRDVQVCKARKAAYYLGNKVLKYNVQILAEHFGKSRSSIQVGICSAEKKLQTDVELRNEIEILTKRIELNLKS